MSTPRENLPGPTQDLGETYKDLGETYKDLDEIVNKNTQISARPHIYT